MDASTLVNLYPWLDHLMAETLLKMSEQGKLDAFVQRSGAQPFANGGVITGAVTVDEKK